MGVTTRAFFYDINGVATLCEPHMHDQSHVLVRAFFLARNTCFHGLASHNWSLIWSF
jgi:hypothetical protein